MPSTSPSSVLRPTGRGLDRRTQQLRPRSIRIRITAPGRGSIACTLAATPCDVPRAQHGSCGSEGRNPSLAITRVGAGWDRSLRWAGSPRAALPAVGAWTPAPSNGHGQGWQRRCAGRCGEEWSGQGFAFAPGPAREHQGACEIGDPSLPCHSGGLPCCVPGLLLLRSMPPRPDTDATRDGACAWSSLSGRDIGFACVRVSPSLVQSLVQRIPAELGILTNTVNP
jgi:hypothetical protein